MGEHEIKSDLNGLQLRLFRKALLEDVRALEQMLDSDLFERNVRRIGAEQELFLVDHAWRPAPVVLEVLEALNDPDYTTELGRFNIEFNLDPLIFGGSCLSQLEKQVVAQVTKARRAANQCGSEVAMVGILPTIVPEDLTLDNMTPISRYYALNEALNKLAGKPYNLDIQGVDEVSLRHDSVMVEACNTSFQVHFQVNPEEFARFYNMTQAVTAPILAAAVNAPLLFGKRLWQETRIALFQQSIDTRSSTEYRRDVPPRVSFGKDWIRSSVLEIFRDDVARFKVLMGLAKDREEPFETIEAGRAPKLDALSLHNGTVYRWNRACYGVKDGLAHLRIEARFLPSGPTPLDETANAAFWFGVLNGMIHTYPDITKVMTFEHAKGNFLAAARHGLQAQFNWIKGRTVPAQMLISNELLPMAREGLRMAKIDEADISRYLDVVEERVSTAKTGSTWFLQSLAGFGTKGSRQERMASLTAATVARQKSGRPVHRWSLALLEEAGEWRENYFRVDQYMTTDLITVDQDEPVDLVSDLMDWQYLRYVPVEDHEHHLVGLVSTRTLMRHLARNPTPDEHDPVPVSAIMQTDLKTVPPDTTTLEAINIMSNERVGCLPVVDNGKLVGLVTEKDFLDISKQLIQEKLRD